MDRITRGNLDDFLFDKLKDKAQQYNVCVEEINPVYTSQRCSQCGWTRKSNRKKKKLVCTKCGYTDDADHNASINISLDLPEIVLKERLLQKNRVGFYWLENKSILNEVREEPTVSSVQKVLVSEK